MTKLNLLKMNTRNYKIIILSIDELKIKDSFVDTDVINTLLGINDSSSFINTIEVIDSVNITLDNLDNTSSYGSCGIQLKYRFNRNLKYGFNQIYVY